MTINPTQASEDALREKDNQVRMLQVVKNKIAAKFQEALKGKP